MNILVDTHSLFWFLTADRKLSKKAKRLIENASTIFLPTIVLLELFYVVKKKIPQESFTSILNNLTSSKRFVFVSLDLAVVQRVLEFSEELEMHDKVIVASAHLLQVPIVTKDRHIRKLYAKTIW